ncbi:EPN2 protein, partial [Atractosteus spatula]|nr:EPN2 protein [Atractosteus spatula]
MTTSSLRRQVKNIVHNYSEAEIKVREATSNDPWGPSSSLMSEISDLTFNVVAFTEVMGMIWKRLNDSGKNWRHVYKALTLLDYLVKTGSERVAQQCKENVFAIQTLKDFQYVDRDGKDQGVNVREKAKQLVALTRDEDRLKQERAHALKTKERMAGVATSMGSYSSRPPAQPAPPAPPALRPGCASALAREESSTRASSSSPHLTSDLEQARPQTSGEEELQLQLALAMSREESEKIQSQFQVELVFSRGSWSGCRLRPMGHAGTPVSTQRKHQASGVSSAAVWGSADRGVRKLPLPFCPGVGSVNVIPVVLVSPAALVPSLLRALAPPPRVDRQGTQLQAATSIRKEVHREPKPAPPTSLEMDEDTQLQIALSLSKEEHEKEQRSRQGDERLLQRALEESRRESASGHQESALMDLVDIFGPAPTTLASTSGDPWDLSADDDHISRRNPPGTSDPWDSVGAHSSSPVTVSPWSPTPASSAPSQPWGSKLTQPDPWESTLRGPSSSPAQAWDSPAHHTGASGSDPFCRLGEGPVECSGLETLPSAQSGSTAELDLFGEPLPSTQMNGRGCSPESFDLTSLGETLGNPSPRACRTPEAFLGPTAASLVNLDSLIPANPPAKNRNPFLSGLSAPSPTNPFQSEQPRLTLNQMRPSSGSPQPGPLPYSASLPLPLSSRAGATLPSSLTQPPTSGAPAFTSPPALLDLPSTLPQPLLPLSSAVPPSLQPDQLSQNPFM